jgi:ribosomal protein S18 acetylase RimI-like enzyme
MRSLPLSSLDAHKLRPLLAEEAAHWQSELLWDYAEVSEAVSAGLERGTLDGRVMREDERCAAYCYYVREASRAVVGAVFAAEPYRGRGIEESLLDEVLAEAQRDGANARVECQTLFSTAPGAEACFSRAGFVSRGRHYLVRDLAPPIPDAAHAGRLRAVRRDDLPQVAEIVHRSHQGSIDASLNLTYATLQQCRHFVDTLVLRGGCGRFDPEASFVAEWAGRPAGVLLASRLSRVAGHVCQVSVLPDVQARGLGGTLVVAALSAFRRQGLRRATLSVTRDNRRAYELYLRLGFEVSRVFGAHAWVRSPGCRELPR